MNLISWKLCYFIMKDKLKIKFNLLLHDLGPHTVVHTISTIIAVPLYGGFSCSSCLLWTFMWKYAGVKKKRMRERGLDDWRTASIMLLRLRLRHLVKCMGNRILQFEYCMHTSQHLLAYANLKTYEQKYSYSYKTKILYPYMVHKMR